MKWLVISFFLLALYGALVGKFLAAVLALFMAGVMMVAEIVFRRQDEQWLASPKSAEKEKDTAEEMSRQDCECSGDRF